MEFGSRKRALRVLIDSGAELNFISQRVIAEEGLSATTSAMRAHAVDGHPVKIYGDHSLMVHATDARGACFPTNHRFLATDLQDFDAILGYAWLYEVDPEVNWKERTWNYREQSSVRIELVSLEELLATAGDTPIGMIRLASVRAHSVSGAFEEHASEIPAAVKLPQEYREFADVFSEKEAQTLSSITKVTHSIPIQEGGSVPYGPIYPLSANELRALREYLNSNLARGWIQRSESPAGAPILFVPKKDGTLRLCVDYRGLNKVTIKNRHPLPLISETLDRLGGAAVYTKLDIRDAYHRIRIHESDVWKTAFRTRYGHFEYLVMPFGLTNAPATFQAYINQALEGLLDVICVAYLDDILIYSRDRAEHASHVRAVLDRLRKKALFVKLSKCEFSTKEVDFLGFVVSTDGISMDPSRVQAIVDWPVPRSFREIQVFLGFTNFYRGFVEKYSKVVAPMTDLLVGMVKGKKTGPFEWPESAESAFQMLKLCFQREPLLAHYDPERQCRVEPDASGEALGSVLTQAYGHPSGNGRVLWRPVAFFSRKMIPAERNYGAPDQEMLAIVASFKEWRHYLESPAKSTLVLTDHQTLRFFMTTKELNRRQARWAEILSPYDFTIEYRRGKDNPADGLSRRPDHMADKPKTGNPLADLLGDRLKQAKDVLSGSMSVGDSGAIRALTRGMTRSQNPTESIFHTLPIQGARKDRAYEMPEILNDGAARTSTSGPSARKKRGRAPKKHAVSEPETLDPSTEGDEESNGDVVMGNAENTPSVMGKIPGALEAEMLALQSQDDWCLAGKWRETPEGKVSSGKYRGYWCEDHAGLVRRQGAVYVPREPAVRHEILRVNHDDPWQGGHFGRERTIEVVRRFYWWAELSKDVRSYILSCDVCQRMKAPRHKPYGLLAPLPQPDGPWQDISMDFITGLPPSAGRRIAYDAVLVVICRFSKMVQYFPCSTDIDAEGLGDVLVAGIFAKFGTPRSIVSDRGTVFTSEYWGTLCYYLAIKRRFSTAFHPQTDGQTERVNQVLECYLRCYVNYFQDNWVKLLPSAEFACNNAMHAVTKRSPFEMVYQFKPTMRINIAGDSRASESQAAKSRSERYQEAAAEVKELWAKAQRSVQRQYNKGRKERSYAPGAKVLLSSKNIRTLRASKKLADKFLGPFEVLKVVGQNAYTLALPKKYGRLHDTFHVSLLEPYHRREGQETPEPMDIDGEEEWEVEEILDHRETREGRQYLVRWKGYSEAGDTWEPLEHLLRAGEMLARYLRSRGLSNDPL